MFSKLQLLQLLIGLVEANDAELINDDELLPAEVCVADERDAVRRLCETIKTLYREFDYLESPEFQSMGEGKSDAFRAMLSRRWSDPEKRQQQLNRFSKALASLLSNDRVYTLTPPAKHKTLDDLKNGFQAVSNRDDDTGT